MSLKSLTMNVLIAFTLATITTPVQCRRNERQRERDSYEDQDTDLSLWITEQQLRVLSGLSMKIYAIYNGRVITDLQDPNFNQNLPTIPSEVNYVNFTWQAGPKKYYYHFDRLHSLDESILKSPTVSIKDKGKIPRDEKGPDADCEKFCDNGICNLDKICQCKAGYMGQYCQKALCYPSCVNGGNCTAPAVCSCPDGYQGGYCEGGICKDKCLNGGKCIQKDKCQCSKGYYGLHCEFSKCVIPCSNGGKCIGINKCRCQPGLGGDHCEIGRRQRSTCKRPCKHGYCQQNGKCRCDNGWYGRNCNQRHRRER